MCWVVGLDCFTATGLYILPRFPLLIYIQILVSAIHTINDNVNNRSFIQSIKQLLRRAGFDLNLNQRPMDIFPLRLQSTALLTELSTVYPVLRNNYIYIPLLIESRATSCHAIAAMLRLRETLLPLGNSYPIQHALTYFPNDT